MGINLMTVRQLINKLEQFPNDIQVVVPRDTTYWGQDEGDNYQEFDGPCEVRLVELDYWMNVFALPKDGDTEQVIAILPYLWEEVMNDTDE